MGVFGCGKEPNVQYTSSDALLLHRCERMLTQIIIKDIFTPPVASRIYVYPSLAAYEASRFISYSSSSIAQRLNGFSNAMPRPEPDKQYDFTVSAIKAFSTTAQVLIFSKAVMEDFANQILQELKPRTNKETFLRSLEFGQKVAEAIIQRISSDNYRETRGMERFEVKMGEPGRWVPTPPDYADAVEPHWRRMKTMVLDSPSQCTVGDPPVYSERKNSVFWNELMEVYEGVNKISDEGEEMNILTFWDDNPFVSRHKGHLMFQDKKMTPGGHWMAIVRIMSQHENQGLFQAAQSYALTSIALYDAFISCWDTKYRTVRLRPETVISSHIEKDWHPHLVTPPFPAYTSGHSTISAAAAEIVTHIFGDQVPFTDSTELEFGLPVRSFKSFREAALEASLSRVYAGIHFRSDCDKGNEQGSKVGKLVLSKLK